MKSPGWFDNFAALGMSTCLRTTVTVIAGPTVRDRVLRDVVERISDGLTVTPGAPGDASAVDGLTRLVIRKVYSAGAIDALLSDFVPSP